MFVKVDPLYKNKQGIFSHLCAIMKSNIGRNVKYEKLIQNIRSVTQQCPTLCDPMDCSTPGFPVHHQLLELAQTHVHRVSDVIQPSLSSPSPPAFNLSQHQGLFQGINSLHQVAKGLGLTFSISPSNEYSGLILFRID